VAVDVTVIYWDMHYDTISISSVYKRWYFTIDIKEAATLCLCSWKYCQICSQKAWNFFFLF